MKNRFDIIYESIILESIKSDIDELAIPNDIKSILKDLKDHNNQPNIKGQKAAIYWIRKNFFDFPQDKMLMLDAIELLGSKIQSFETINSKEELSAKVEENRQRLADKQAKKEAKTFNPTTEPTFSNPYDAGDGVVIYQVEDSKAGQMAVRRAADQSWRSQLQWLVSDC